MKTAGHTAQAEGATVGWDARDFHEGLQLDWSFFAAAAVVGLVGYVLYRQFQRCIGWWHEMLPWRRMRYWWPSAMLAYGIGVALLGDWGVVPAMVLFVFAFLFFAVNFPAILVTGPVIGALAWLFAPGWVILTAAAAVFWLAWFAIIRWMEAWSPRKGVVSLDIDRARD